MFTQLVYTSRCRIAGPVDQLAFTVRSIADHSRRSNAAAGVTGGMMLHDGIFAQVLEGANQSAELVFERIARDPRHSDVVLLAKNRVPERCFPQWSMALLGAGRASVLRVPAADAASGMDLAALSGEEILEMLQRLSRETMRGLEPACPG